MSLEFDRYVVNRYEKVETAVTSFAGASDYAGFTLTTDMQVDRGRLPATFDARFVITNPTANQQPAAAGTMNEWYVGLVVGGNPNTCWRPVTVSGYGWENAISQKDGVTGVAAKALTGTYSLAADANDGRIYSGPLVGSSWDVVRNLAAGSGDLTANSLDNPVARALWDVGDNSFYCEQTFLELDTSAITTNDAIQRLRLTLSVDNAQSDDSLDVEVWQHSWAVPGTLSTNDWVPGSTLQTWYNSGLRLVAKSITDCNTDGYIDIPYGSWLNIGGTTSLLLTISAQRTGVAPAGENNIRLTNATTALELQQTADQGDGPRAVLAYSGPDIASGARLMQTVVKDPATFNNVANPPDCRVQLTAPPSTVRFNEPFLDHWHQVRVTVSEPADLIETTNTLIQPYRIEVQFDSSQPFAFEQYLHESFPINLYVATSSAQSYSLYGNTLAIYTRPTMGAFQQAYNQD